MLQLHQIALQAPDHGERPLRNRLVSRAGKHAGERLLAEGNDRLEFGRRAEPATLNLVVHIV
jgi:hypothetical protein